MSCELRAAGRYIRGCEGMITFLTDPFYMERSYVQNRVQKKG